MSLYNYKPKVLLIDDEPLLLEMFESVLNTKGLDVFTARSANEALQLLRSNEFEVLVTDVLLEDFDGFEIQAKAKKLYPNIVTILITGAPNPIDAQRADLLDIPYLSKPVGFETLIKTIQNHLDNKWDSEKKRRVNGAHSL